MKKIKTENKSIVKLSEDKGLSLVIKEGGDQPAKVTVSNKRIVSK